MKVLPTYEKTVKNFGKYWTIYGGLSAMLKSAYLHAAVVFSALAYPLWSGKDSDWPSIALGVTPSILGFALGGYAVLFAFGDEKFRLIISGPDKDGRASPFMEANAAFVHFIVVNVVSLAFAVLLKAWPHACLPIMGFAFCVFSYSLFTALAAVMGIFHVAGWADKYAETEKKIAGQSHQE